MIYVSIDIFIQEIYSNLFKWQTIFYAKLIESIDENI